MVRSCTPLWEYSSSSYHNFMFVIITSHMEKKEKEETRKFAKLCPFYSWAVSAPYLIALNTRPFASPYWLISGHGGGSLRFEWVRTERVAGGVDSSTSQPASPACRPVACMPPLDVCYSSLTCAFPLELHSLSKSPSFTGRPARRCLPLPCLPSLGFFAHRRSTSFLQPISGCAGDRIHHRTRPAVIFIEEKNIRYSDCTISYATGL